MAVSTWLVMASNNRLFSSLQPFEWTKLTAPNTPMTLSRKISGTHIIECNHSLRSWAAYNSPVRNASLAALSIR
jgi:hypothetical protein